MVEARSRFRNFAWYGSLALILGLLPMMAVVGFASSCFDVCLDVPVSRIVVFISAVFLLPGLFLSGIPWLANTRQAFKHERPSNHLAAYILPVPLLVLFGILTSSVEGNALFPRTYSNHDPWMYAWFIMITLLVIWSLAMNYWSRPAQRLQSEWQHTEQRIFRYVGFFLLCLYFSFTVRIAAYLIYIKYVIPEQAMINLIAVFWSPVPEDVISEANDFATIIFYSAMSCLVLFLGVLFIKELKWRKQD